MRLTSLAAETVCELGLGAGRVNLRDDRRFESAGARCINTLQQFGSVLAAEDDRIDAVHRQRIAMRERRSRHTQVSSERTELAGIGVVHDDAVIGRQLPINCVGQRAALHGANTSTPALALFVAAMIALARVGPS